MSRIRTIKPEFWTDERVGRLSPLARLLFIATWNFADDMGTCRASAAYLRGQAFPYDNLSNADVERLLGELERMSLVRFFVDEDQTYLSIHHFRRHQKINNPSGAKHPNPPVALWESSYRPHVALPVGREGKGSEPDQNQNPRAGARVVLVGGEGPT